jgi:uncharacterized protein (TIGR02145 family)
VITMKERISILTTLLIAAPLLFAFLIGCNNDTEQRKHSEKIEISSKGKTNQTTKTDTNIGSKSIKIGNQVWMAENLNISKFRNGDPIAEAKNQVEWKSMSEKGEPAWCYYDNDSSNGNIYGKLYNWYAVNDSRGLAPVGWHIPNTEEWEKLEAYLGKAVAGDKMKSSEGWNSNFNGNNSSGFSALPGGYCDKDGLFTSAGSTGNWWSTKKIYRNFAWQFILTSKSIAFLRYTIHATGNSVRCIKD